MFAMTLPKRDKKRAVVPTSEKKEDKPSEKKEKPHKMDIFYARKPKKKKVRIDEEQNTVHPIPTIEEEEQEKEEAKKEKGLKAFLKSLRDKLRASPGAPQNIIYVKRKGNNLIVQRILSSRKDRETTSIEEFYFKRPISDVYFVETRISLPDVHLVIGHSTGEYRIKTNMTEAGYTLLAIKSALNAK